MSKRKLTRRQTWRIQKIQDERVKREQKKALNVDQDPQNELGAETKGLVIANYGSHLVIEKQAGEIYSCVSRQNLGAIVCGDQVIWQPTSDTEGVITAVLERKNLLERPGAYQIEPKPIAANIDQILIISAPLPELQTLLIDRYLVATELNAIPAIIVINKADLLDNEKRVAFENITNVYAAMDYRVIYCSSKSILGRDELNDVLLNKTSILVGQSGVGKSSTIKSVLPNIDIQIGELTQIGKLGRHTTSATRLYHLPNGGGIIDSPGVRDFGLWHFPKEKIVRAFREFRPFLGKCKFSNCSHTIEPECALLAAISEGAIAPFRFKNYTAILQSLDQNPKLN